MDVSVSQFRAELARHLRAARDGQEVIITDRGVPVARLGPAHERSLIDDLVRDGVLSAPTKPKFKASERHPVSARGSVSEILLAQREPTNG